MQQHRDDQNNALSPFGILIHLGLLAFGIAAFMTGLLAGDYKRIVHTGFTVHSWIGMILVFFAVLRLITGVGGSSNERFSNWMPFTMARLKPVMEDISGLFRMRLPERPTHQGLSGLVQTFGLFVFFFMAATGAALFFVLEPGQKARGFAHDVKELHELGMALIPMFLAFHVGAVIMHALRGNHVWKKIFFNFDTMKEAGKSS